MEIIKRELWVTQKRMLLPVPYVQGTNAVTLEFSFMDYTIPSGATARIYIKKPSGKEVYNTATVKNNVVTVKPTTQMFAEAGEYPGQIQIVKSSSILATFLIPFQVERNIVSESAVQSANEYGILDELIEDARTTISNMEGLIDQVETKLKNGEFDGPKGDTGEDGATWLFGTSVPSSSTGKNGDFYLRTSTYDVYQKSSGSWTKKGNIKGATGATGATGAAATITVGTVTTGEPGTQAKVTNSGTSGAAVFDFTIPRGATGEIENLDTATVNFTQASTRSNILPTDTLKVILGKIKKFFADLHTVAFSGSYSDLKDKPTIPSIVNNLTSTSTDSGLSAAMGKQLADNQGNLSDLDTTEKDSLVGAINAEHARIQYGKTGVINASAGPGNLGTGLLNQQIGDVTITFPKKFSNIPMVIVGIVSPNVELAEANVNYGGISVTVKDGSITTSGFVLRAFNDSGGGVSPQATWIAIGD